MRANTSSSVPQPSIRTQQSGAVEQLEERRGLGRVERQPVVDHGRVVVGATAREEPPPGLVGREVEVDGGIEPVGVALEEGGGLLGRAREAVEEIAPLAHLRRVEGVLDDAEHDVVGHELPLLHVGLGEAAELGVHLDVRGAGPRPSRGGRDRAHARGARPACPSPIRVDRR